MGLDDVRPKTRGNNQSRSLGGTTIITLNFMVSSNYLNLNIKYNLKGYERVPK